MQSTQSIRYAAILPWLAGKASNVYSQFGEDGLIEAILNRIGTTNRQCFEIGAADGKWYSNTLRLRERGWRAILIEADDLLAQMLIENYGNDATCIHERTTDLTTTLRSAGCTQTPDCGVIDIDGQDWHLWAGLTIQPRVMMVETHPDPDFPVPDHGGDGQAGLSAIESLGRDKGYTLAATTYCNAIFIDSKEL